MKDSTESRDLDKMVREAVDEIEGGLPLAEAITAALGHDKWTGDVDPLAEIAYREAQERIVRQLIAGGGILVEARNLEKGDIIRDPLPIGSRALEVDQVLLKERDFGDRIIVEARPLLPGTEKGSHRRAEFDADAEIHIDREERKRIAVKRWNASLEIWERDEIANGFPEDEQVLLASGALAQMSDWIVDEGEES